MTILDGSHYGVKVSPSQWQTVWLWIESGAPYAGSYAALRNEQEQAAAYTAVAKVFHEGGEVLKRRCGQCHALGDPASERGRPLPFNPIAARNRRGLTRPTGIWERVVLEDDPLTRFSSNILLNLTRPHLSPLLLGPLAKKAGGYGSCGSVFTSTEDADYRRLLSVIEQSKARLDAVPRYGMPDFKPNRQYLREMVRYGVLAPSFDLSKDDIDVFQLDQAYWRTSWHRPAGALIERRR
jgi:hypothetical protein